MRTPNLLPSGMSKTQQSCENNLMIIFIIQMENSTSLLRM